MSMCEAPPQRKNRIVDFAGLRRRSAVSAPKADFPKGRPKHAAVDAVRNERLLSADENRGEECGGSIGCDGHGRGAQWVGCRRVTAEYSFRRGRMEVIINKVFGSPGQGAEAKGWQSFAA